MADTPPGDLLRPPDHHQSVHIEHLNKPQQELYTTLSHSSSNLHITGAITVASSKKELDNQKNISQEEHDLIRNKGDNGLNSLQKDPSTVKTDQSIVSIERSHTAEDQPIAPKSQTQNSGSVDEIREDSNVGNQLI